MLAIDAVSTFPPDITVFWWCAVYMALQHNCCTINATQEYRYAWYK